MKTKYYIRIWKQQNEKEDLLEYSNLKTAKTEYTKIKNANPQYRLALVKVTEDEVKHITNETLLDFVTAQAINNRLEIITDALLPAKWSCPACGTLNTTSFSDNYCFIGTGKTNFICKNCGCSKYFKLNLSESFREQCIKSIIDICKNQKRKNLKNDKNL